MDISCIPNENEDSMNISDIIKKNVYYAHDHILYKFDILGNSKEVIFKFKSVIDYIKIIKGRILVIMGNTCELFSISYKNVIQTFCFESLPKKIKCYADKLYILTEQNKFHIIDDELIYQISIFRNQDMLDFSIDQEIGFFLFNDSKIYRIENLSKKKEFFAFRNKESLIPCNELSNFISIEIFGNKLYLLSIENVQIYNIKKTHCSLIYKYINKNISYLHNYNGIYCKSNEVILLDHVPFKIISDENVLLIKNYAISNQYIYYWSESYIKKNKKEQSIRLLKESNVQERVNELFSKIIYDSSYTIEEFREKIIDGLKSIYIQLKTMNDSFEEKVDIIREKSILVKQKYDSLSKKRMLLDQRASEVDKKIDSLIKKKKIEIVTRNKDKILEMKKNLNEYKENINKNIVEIRLQNEVLKEIVNEMFTK